MVKYICYNWMPMFADHCMDRSDEFYKSVGVSRLHDLPNFNPREVCDGDVIFVKTDYIYDGYFQNYVFPQINNKFILVSGISSYHVGCNGDMSYEKIMNSPNLIKWFCTNPPSLKNNKIIPIPIGFEEIERDGGNQTFLLEQRQARTKFHDKKNKILLPYHTLNTNPKRRNLFNSLRNLDFVEVQKDKLPFKEYMQLLDQYKFVICLEGAGPDVHRNYECLLVDSVPINVKNTIEFLFKYHEVPGVFLDSWDNLNDQKFDDLVSFEYNFENNKKFLTIDYHAKLIGDINEN